MINGFESLPLKDILTVYYQYPQRFELTFCHEKTILRPPRLIINLPMFLEEITLIDSTSLKDENARLLAHQQLPYYPQGLEADLESYAKAILDTSSVNKHNLPPLVFNQTLMRNKQRKRLLETALITKLSGNVVAYEAGPVVLELIKAHCQRQMNAEMIAVIHQALPNVSTDELSGLSDLELAAEYQRCMAFTQLIANINAKFNYLVLEKTGNNSHDISSFQVGYRLTTLQPTVEAAYKSAQFNFISRDEVSGYSMHNLLLMAEILETTYTATGNIPPVFNGNHGCGLAFVLSYDEIIKLKLYLTELYEQEKDFTGILSELLGKNTEHYFRTGEKSIAEVIKIEEGRARNGLPPFMHPEVFARFKMLPPTTSVLFLAQPCLDLKAHPDRDKLKALIESIYRTNEVKDGKGEVKTFVTGTYQSMMAIKHIRAIFNDIMHIASIASSAQAMGFTSVSDPIFLMIMAASNVQQVLFQEHRTRLIEIAKICQNSAGPTNLSSSMFCRSAQPSRQLAHQAAEREADSLYRMPVSQNMEKLSDVYQRYLTSICNILDKNTGCIIKKMTVAPNISISDDETLVLLSSGHRDTAVLYPINDQEIDTLCRYLQSCDSYRFMAEKYHAYAQSAYGSTHIAPTLDAAIEQSTNEFKRRLIAYRGSSVWYNSSETITQTLQSFMMFAVKIYYAERLNISRKALERSAARLADLASAAPDGRHDLAQGCGAGLAGRWLTISSQLISLDENPIQAAIKQLLIDSVEEAYTQTQLRRDNSESSMVAQRKSFFLQLAGLEYGNTAGGHYDNPTTFMQALSSRFTPSKIFQTCFDMLIENFKQQVRDENYTKIYELFATIGYSANTPQEQAELQANFCVNDKWCLSKFQKELPERLIEILKAQPQLAFNAAHKSTLCFLDETGRQTYQCPLNSTVSRTRATVQSSQATSHAAMWAQSQSATNAQTQQAQVRDVSNSAIARSTYTPGG